MSFEIKKENKDVFSAKFQSEKTIVKYEFEKMDKGWYVDKSTWSVEAPFPKKESIYLPNEVIDQILMIESVKDKLVD